MPQVTVAIQRNLLWSLKFNTTLNLIFADVNTIDCNTISNQLKNFLQETTFQIGHATLIKTTSWKLIFPGIPLNFSNWLVSINAPEQNTMHLDVTDTDIQTLLEFLVHMHSSGQKLYSKETYAPRITNLSTPLMGSSFNLTI